MSKIIQETKKEEEPAVAEPKSVCLISTSLNKRQFSSFGPGVSSISGNPQLGSGSVNAAGGNFERDIVQNRVQNPETCSQVLKGDNQSHKRCGKLRAGLCPRQHALKFKGLREPATKDCNSTTDDQVGPP